MGMLSQKQKIYIIIGIVIAIGIIGYYYINSTKEVYNYGTDTLEANENNENQEEIQEAKIIVHVTGAVKQEGIVEVKENARINDVIQEAGGLTDDADLDSVNLAYIVEDGQKIYIPSKMDNHEQLDDGDVMSVIPGVEKNANQEDTKNGLININTADVNKLKEIPGIGDATAQKIITYRKENR